MRWWVSTGGVRNTEGDREEGSEERESPPLQRMLPPWVPSMHGGVPSSTLGPLPGPLVMRRLTIKPKSGRAVRERRTRSEHPSVHPLRDVHSYRRWTVPRLPAANLNHGLSSNPCSGIGYRSTLGPLPGPLLIRCVPPRARLGCVPMLRLAQPPDRGEV